MVLLVTKYYKEKKTLLDNAIREFAEKNELPSRTVLGGKRLRGVLCIMVCEALGGQDKDALDAAIAVELAHAASLDLDDILDMDVIRRGGPAEWVTKGVIRATLGTHALVASAFSLVRKYGGKALKIFTDTYHRMLAGEIKDVTEGDLYEAIISAKTAALWSAAAELGAIAARREDALVPAGNYGLATGMAFQIADDIRDTIAIIEKMEIRKLLQPSVTAFLAYLGLEVLLKNPVKLLMKGIQGIKEDIHNAAAQKLDKWVRKAQGYANVLPIKNTEYVSLLMDYPAMAADLMLRKG